MAMFGTSWRVARIAGIEVRIDSSWVVVALLITYSMYLRLSVLYPELSDAGAVGLAVVSRCCSSARSWSTSWPTRQSPRPGASGSRTSPCSCSASRRGGLAAGRRPGRWDLVRVHQLVPGPDRPLLLPGAPAAADCCAGSRTARPDGSTHRQTTTGQSRWPPADANAPRRQPDLAGRVHRVDGATAWQLPGDRRAVRRLVPAPMRGNGNV